MLGPYFKMGQSHSSEHPTFTKEQLSDQLALRFLRHCFSNIEIYSFRDNFESLAQETYSQDAPSSLASSSMPSGSPSSGATPNPHKILYWTEDTLTRFLGLPDALAPIGPILYQSATYLGAFPFEQDLAPVVLTFEALVKVVALMTGRHEKVLRKGCERSKKGGIDWVKMVWKSFAIWERELAVVMEKSNEEGSGSRGQTNTQLERVREEETLFAIGDDDDDEDVESLTLAALDALDALEAFDLPKKQEKEKQPKRIQVQSARIPIDNMRVIIMLLLLVAPLEPTQPIAAFVERFTADGLASLKAAAENVLRGFTSMSEEGKKGIGWSVFKATVKRSMPYLFDGFLPLYEHFLFSKNVNMSSTAICSQRPPPLATSPTSPSSPSSRTHQISPNIIDLTQPLLPSPGQILNVDILCQISLFLPGSRLWRRLRHLYAGSSAGFSMGTFETHVLKWQAPTILLVSGGRIPPSPETAPERSFAGSLPQKWYPTSSDEVSEKLVYGVYLNVPWRLSHKECFGDVDTVLFQLAPVHEVFHASSSNKEYAHFNKSNGIGFGNQLPHHAGYKVPSHSSKQHLDLGPVSLTFDEGLVYGVFNHVGDGGAFLRSDTRNISGDNVWQDRFEIEEIEVWGVGGDKEAEEQRRQWDWEEREALLRRSINLGKDIEADRALLEMAGLVGQNMSGGSIG